MPRFSLYRSVNSGAISTPPGLLGEGSSGAVRIGLSAAQTRLLRLIRSPDYSDFKALSYSLSCYTPKEFLIFCSKDQVATSLVNIYFI